MTTLHEMWVRLAQHQPYADANGYGPAWAKMCKKQTAEAARAAWDATQDAASAAEDARHPDAAWDAWDVWGARAAGDAALAAEDAAEDAGEDSIWAAEPIRRIEKAERIYGEMETMAKPETCKPALQVERADARRGRWLLDKMRHQNYGPNSGWTLTDIYPGDDAAAAIDAAMAKERGDD
jgi:hypothetical protein